MSTIALSLLDRLIDGDPEQAFEPVESDEAVLAQYRTSLRRDLENLLNARCPDLVGLERHPELERTVVGYGLHDISTEDLSTAGARDRIRRMVAQAIRLHETRLSHVQVDIDDRVTSRGIRLRVTAQLNLTRTRETVVYEAAVRPGDRTIAVKLGD
jgi:type VI secretion system protein ImpF